MVIMRVKVGLRHMTLFRLWFQHVLKAKKLKLDEKGVCINALKNVEEALRRSNKLEVEARNQMLAVSKMLRQIVS